MVFFKIALSPILPRRVILSGGDNLREQIFCGAELRLSEVPSVARQDLGG